MNEVIEILQMEDSTRQTLTEMKSSVQKINYASYEKQKSKSRGNPNSKIILILLILLLAHRNKILQVPPSSATNATSPTPKVMRMSARQEMPSVMAVVPSDITR